MHLCPANVFEDLPDLIKSQHIHLLNSFVDQTNSLPYQEKSTGPRPLDQADLLCNEVLNVGESAGWFAQQLIHH